MLRQCLCHASRALILGVLFLLGTQIVLLQRIASHGGASLALHSGGHDIVLSLRHFADGGSPAPQGPGLEPRAEAPLPPPPPPRLRAVAAAQPTVPPQPRAAVAAVSPPPLPPVPPGFTLKIGVDFKGNDLPTPRGGNAHTTVYGAARTCAANPSCSGFVMKGRPGDWRRGWAVYYKGGSMRSESANPSMFSLVKTFATIPWELSQAAAPVASAAAVVSAASSAAAAAPCTNDAECAASAPAGRSAVCLAVEDDARRCFEAEGPWLGKLRRRTSNAKLFDGFLFNNEFDLLEMRLHEVYPVVDAIILVEASFTFQNDAKPLYFADYIARDPQRFARFMDKIEHVKIVDGDAEVAALREKARSDNWAIEVYCRDAIAHRGIPIVRASRGATSSDLIMITDVDEVPRRDVARLLTQYDGYPAVVNFEMLWSYFGFYWLNPSPWETMGGALVTVGLMESKGYAANELRKGHFGEAMWMLPSAGHHCSWCFPLKDYIIKAASFSHHEFKSRMEGEAGIKERKCSGLFMGADRVEGTRQHFASDVPLFAVRPPLVASAAEARLPELMRHPFRPARLDYLLAPECDSS